MHVRAGHFLDEDIAKFDAAFFNFSAETASVRSISSSFSVSANIVLH